MARSLLSVLLLLAVAGLVAAAADPKECEVCKKVVGRIHSGLSKEEKKDLVTVESSLTRFCEGTRDDAEKKLCYFLQPIQREGLSQPTKNGAPVDRICKRLKRSSAEICSLRYAEKIDLSAVKPQKMRVKALRKLLAEYGEHCDGCLEKRDFVKKVEALQAKHAAGDL